MPGIAGVISKISQDEKADMLDRMIEPMIHNSTSVHGTYVNKEVGVFIGWVVHESSKTNCMPIWNETKSSCIMFYGENYFDLKQIDAIKSAGHQFDSRDYSYLIHLYEEFGKDFFKQLNGFFHGVIVDLEYNKIVLFNDRFGMQRLYFYEDEDCFYFSSEAKSILNVRPDLRQIHESNLGQVLSMGCVLGNETIFRNIYTLPLSSMWTFENGVCCGKERYFDPSSWENQTAMGMDDFYEELKGNFTAILPKYIHDDRKVALSLTGGLDTRMIIAYAKHAPGDLPCYTFGSMYRNTFDVSVAKLIAKELGHNHHTIEVGKEFLKRFPSLAERAVYITDGNLDAASGAAELYANEVAADIAPIRITGNYGSEVLRSVIAFKPKPRSLDIFDPDYRHHIVNAKRIYDDHISIHGLTFTVFKQAPWFNFNRLIVEQSQLINRTPFMDNALIELAYRAPAEAIQSDLLSHRLVKDGNPALSNIITNRGAGGGNYTPFSKLRQSYHEFLHLAEIGYDYDMPNLLSKIDHAFSFLHLEKLFLGTHSFLHFRIWYRDLLCSYIKDLLLDQRSLRRDHINKKMAIKMIENHIKGTSNYTTEISQLLTIELIYRLFIDL